MASQIFQLFFQLFQPEFNRYSYRLPLRFMSPRMGKLKNGVTSYDIIPVFKFGLRLVNPNQKGKGQHENKDIFVNRFKKRVFSSKKEFILRAEKKFY